MTILTDLYVRIIMVVDLSPVITNRRAAFQADTENVPCVKLRKEYVMDALVGGSMKKRIIIALTGIIAALFVSYLVVLAKTESEIPFFNDVSFGSTCDEIVSRFGEPITIEANKYDMGLTFYEYRFPVLNEEGEVQFAFAETGLGHVYIYWNLSSEEEANEMFHRIRQEIRDAFWWRIDFKTYDSEASSDLDSEVCKQTFGLTQPNSARQIYYSVEKEGTTVFVRCLDYTGS